MHVAFGKHAITSRGRPLSVVAHLKQSIVEVKAEENCVGHALVIAIAMVDKDPNFNAYIQASKICPVVQNLLDTTGIELSNGAGIPKLVRFEEHFREYKIVVYRGLSCDNIMFEGQVDTARGSNILYNVVERYYHVIAKLIGAITIM